MQKGFTLIELSIVLVIIGLVIGGVVVGQDLITAATIRAQITQIEKYNASVNTFRGKYGYLPGDMPDPQASNAGLMSRYIAGQCPPNCFGFGDGNGILEGGSVPAVAGVNIAEGEGMLFWNDLSAANLIDGSYAGPIYYFATQASGMLPPAKIGRGNYVYVYNNGYDDGVNWVSNGINYFGISVFHDFEDWALNSMPGMTVTEAYNIDRKVDDGLPQSGSVTAQYVSFNTYNTSASWAHGGALPEPMGAYTAGAIPGPTTAATTGDATTCYDNNNTTGPQTYSTRQNNGTGINCALSFRFQ